MNKLRFLSLVMSVVFIFACFPFVNTMASTIGLYEDEYAHSLDVLKTICPDFPLESNDTTTRDEFVAAVVMALGIPQGTAPASAFRDVDAESKYSPYIAYAAQLGLISNVDLFYPSSPVTYEQAIKIIMSAAGYAKKAEITGGYPLGYIKTAHDAGVGKNISVSNDSTLTHGQATELIFEACTADIMEETTFGDSSDYSVTAGKNIFSTYHKIYMAEGVVSANEHTGIRSISSASPEGYITIDDINYAIGGFDDFLGRRVRVFYKNNSSRDIIYIYPCNNKVFKYSAKDTPYLSGSVLTAYSQEDKKEIKYNMEDYSILYNGKCFNTSDPEGCVNSSGGSITLVDNDGNGRINIIEITEPRYGIISSVNEIDEKVYDKYQRGAMLALADVKYSVREDDGTPIELGSLKEDDAVGYVVSKDGKKCEIIRYNQKKGGVLDSITSQNKIVVSGEEYSLSEYYTANIKLPAAIKTGSDVILSIGEDGSVIYVKEFVSDIRYGYYIASGSMGNLGAEPKVMVFGDDGEMHEYSLADKVKIDGVSHTRAETLTKLADQEARGSLYRVIKYSLNPDEKVYKLYLTIDNTLGSQVFLTRTQIESSPVLYDDNEEQGYSANSAGNVPQGMLYYKNEVFYPHFTMAPDCVILKVPKSSGDIFNEDYYSLATSTDVRDGASGNSIECYGYDVDVEGASFILWLSDEGGSAQVPTESANGVVEEKTEGVSPNGDKCYVLKLFLDGKAEKYYSTENSYDAVKDMSPGDIVQVSYNRDREITAAEINFDWSEKEIVGTNAKAPQGYGDATVEFAAGYFYSFSGKAGMIVRNIKSVEDIVSAGNLWGYKPVANGSRTDYHTNLYPANLARGEVYFVKFNYIRGETTPYEAVVHTEGDASSIESVYSAGVDADYMVQRARYHDVYYTFVYVN